MRLPGSESKGFSPRCAGPRHRRKPGGDAGGDPGVLRAGVRPGNTLTQGNDGRATPPDPRPVVGKEAAFSGASEARPISKWTSTWKSVSRFVPDFDTNLDSVLAPRCPLRHRSRKASSSWIPFRQLATITTFDSPQQPDGASSSVPSGGGPAGGEVMRVDQAFGPVSQPRPEAAPSAPVSSAQVAEYLGHAPPELGEVSTTGSRPHRRGYDP